MPPGDSSKKQPTAAQPTGLQGDHYWMSLALAEAGQCGLDVPVGSIVVRNDELLASGRNRREIDCDPTGHAEMIALRQAAQVSSTWRLEGTTIYTTLEPCPMCAEAIIQSRVSRLVFGAYDVASGACGSAFNLFVKGRIFPIPEVIGGVCEEDCRKLLVEFFRSRPGADGGAAR